MRDVDLLVVHCSATEEGKDYSVDDIREWHTAKGWSDVGYHFVIRLDGTVEKGRPVDTVGAHARGYNTNSIGICLVGGLRDGQPEDTYTNSQLDALRQLLQSLQLVFPDAQVLGHKDLPNVAKACPCFHVTGWWSRLL